MGKNTPTARHSLLGYFSCLIFELALDPLAIGQTASPAAAPALDEIIVTAQKREERLQDVPITVSAFTPQTLADNKIETTSDLQLLVPALVYNQLGGFALPFLRGIGTDVTQPNSDPSVATYIDGAFVSNDQATIQNLLGVERIEVLEGPQGTLYGRNAVGGAINVITTTPKQALDGHVTLTTGQFAQKEGSAALSGGVTDQLAVGLYVAGTKENSYINTQRYSALADEGPQDERSWGIRFKAVYTPSDWLKLTASAEKTQANSHDASTLRNTSPNALGYLLVPTDPQIIEPYVSQSAWPQFHKTFGENYTVREEGSLPWSNLVGISNYRNTLVESSVDVGTTPAPLAVTTSPILSSRQYSQELQLLSLDSSPIRWITGLFFFHENAGFLPNTVQSFILFQPSPVFSENNFGIVETESYAAFGEVTLPLAFITEGLRLTVGGRYNVDRKHFSDNQSTTAEDGTLVGPVTSYPKLHAQWSKFTPKVTLDYKWSETLFYAAYSEGFKSGAYNITAPATPGPVNPEDLKAFEVGTKSDFFNRRLQWNNSAYYYNFKDIQVEVINFAADGETFLENAAAARAYGLESSLSAAVTDGFTANLGMSLEHSRYTKYADASGVNPVTLASTTFSAQGNQLQRTPEAVFTAGADYKWELPNGSHVRTDVHLYHNGGYYWTSQNSVRQPAYTLVNASLTYAASAHWNIVGWVNNLTNKYYADTVLPQSPFGILALDAPPRTFGLTATVSVH